MVSYGLVAYRLRISEAITLPISGVDSKQMVLHVIGKPTRNMSDEQKQAARERMQRMHEQRKVVPR